MIGVNLIPESILLAQMRSLHIKRWLVSALAAGALLAVPLTMDWLERAKATELRMLDSQTQAQLVSIRADLKTLTSQSNEALLQLERARALRSKRAWSAMFVVIGQCMPAECWLTSVATDPPRPGEGNANRASGSPSTPQAAAAHPAGSGKPVAGSGPLVIEAPRRLIIAGYASQAAEPHQFVTNLKATGVFANVALSRSHREPALDGSYFRFELVCEW